MINKGSKSVLATIAAGAVSNKSGTGFNFIDQSEFDAISVLGSPVMSINGAHVFIMLY